MNLENSFSSTNLELTPPAPPAILSEVRLKDWLDQLEARLEKVSVAYNSASFNKYIGRAAADLNQYDAAFSALLTEPAYRATVRHWLSHASDPQLKRRLTLFERAFLEAQVSKSQAIYELRNVINDRLINYRPQIGSEYLSRNDVTAILRSHPDRTRRQLAFEQALRPLAEELSPQVARLMQQRNSEARTLGYPTYADLHLNLLGFDRAGLWTLFDQLEEMTAGPYRAFLEAARQTYGLQKVEAWDLQWLADRRASLPDEPFRRERVVPLAHELLTDFGLDPTRLPIEVVQQNIPFGGLCFSLKIPDDIRIVCNPKDGYLFCRTMVHEFGHGLHAAFIRQPTYFFKREWGPFNEGMAETLAYFTQHEEWLGRVTGLDTPQLAHYGRENSVRRMLRLRNLMAQARFEIEAYDDPSADLQRLHADYEARYLLVPTNLTPRWAATSFPTTHPIYRQNYILADLIAAQTHAELRRRFGSFFQLPTRERASVFAFLKDHYYAPGASVDWRDKIQAATGQPISAAALVGELALQN